MCSRTRSRTYARKHARACTYTWHGCVGVCRHQFPMEMQAVHEHVTDGRVLVVAVLMEETVSANLFLEALGFQVCV